MKLESTLDRRPALLHLAPVLDVMGLMLFFFLLAGSLITPGGVGVDLPISSSQLPPLAKSHVVLIAAGDPPLVLFDRAEMSYEALLEALAKPPEDDRYAVYFKMDRRLSSGMTMEVMDAALRGGYQVFQATTSKEASAPSNAAGDSNGPTP